jgi:D-alanyl-D-alanine carboxypeptidase (penicillin-binding protein 5/6)
VHQHSVKDTGGDGEESGKRRPRKLLWTVLAVAAILIGAGTWVAVDRITTPLAKPVTQPADVASAVVPGAAPMLPWPAKGQGAVAVPSIGYTSQSGPESSVPIASLTKMTTAVVTLRDHPLPAGSDGPAITVTPADAAEYQTELHSDESSVDIQVGETLTERQMLEALLTQSANDMAFSLAEWDAGSVEAFVDKMNALATLLGTTDTHYVDASGYDPQSVSSASDVLRIATAGMAIPAFAQTVDLTSVTLPLVGTLHNIVSEIGVNGVVGIKSGYTSSADACMVLAANRTVQHRQVLVLVAVLGQPTPSPTLPKSTTTTTRAPANSIPVSTTTSAPPNPTTTTAPPHSPTPVPTTTTTTIPLNDLPIADPFKYAGPTTDALLAATEAAVIPVSVATSGEVAGTVTSTWGGVPHAATVVTGTSAWLPGWPGQTVDAMTRFTSVAPGSPRGTRVGVRLFAIGAQSQAVTLRLAGIVPEPSTWWRLVHA